MEYFSPFVIEEQDAYIASVVGIPEGVHVVEETQVADEDEIEFVGRRSVADGSRQRTFYTVSSSVG